MKRLLIFLMFVPAFLSSVAATEMTVARAKTYYKAQDVGHLSIHDPSVVYEPNTKRYYIFGTHRGQGYTSNFSGWSSMTAPWEKYNASTGKVTSNVANAEAFSQQQIDSITIGGKRVEFQNFDAKAWAAARSQNYYIDGMMWAPDVIWNPYLKKWCMYLSIDGDNWASSIILLTSNKINGPYVYQGPVVISGFQWTTNPYKKTDLELAIGTQNSLPSRYDKGSSWGRYWPNCIDPCVFFDDEGELWMSYGSWSGGIFLLRLDKTTGLRDYDYTYSTGTGDERSWKSDPYFGIKIAGGYYVSGEGSYIEHIGDYYYLFVTYGGLASDGGYEMRVFRSKDVTGPYLDSKGVNAVFSSYVMNYGQNGDKRGMKILGAYKHWGFMNTPELAQGHNSIIHTIDDQNLLVYHTRFDNGNEFFQNRVQQVFVNEEGWLVAAPFQYHKEKITDEQIKTVQPFTVEDIVGVYSSINHGYGLNYANKETVDTIEYRFCEDGTIMRPKFGTTVGKWSIKEGTSYVEITLYSRKYSGVISEQQMDYYNMKSVCITAACSATGVNMWFHKMRNDYALAWQINNLTSPLKEGQQISSNVDLALNVGQNVEYEWTSDNPGVLSAEGVANADVDTDVTMTLHLSCGDYYCDIPYTVTVKSGTSGIKNIKSDTKAEAIYDLSGSKVKVGKGLYIKGKKKIFSF